MVKKFPSFSQWKQIFKVLKKKEKITFIIFVILAFCSLSYLLISLYINSTKKAPAFGGEYTEGIVGQPRFINPIYGETNDVDRTIIELVYSGLMTYDKDGKIVNDLAKDYQVSSDGKTYSFTLKDKLQWQDGTPLTVDDVLYTIKTIQNSDYKSPLRANWIDVEAKKTSDNSFNLLLKSPYNSFLESCVLKIIPQHIWQNISPENFTLSSYNLKPIGSGPYTLSNLQQTNSGLIKSINLAVNRKYYDKLPYIPNISFQFFGSKEDLIKAANQKTIDGFSLASFDNNQTEAEKEIRQGWSKNEKFDVYSFTLPRYFAVFFNIDKSKLFSDENIRKALVYSVDKNELAKSINSLYGGSASIVNSPILPDFFKYNSPTASYDLDIKAAQALLDKDGFKDNGSGQRAKASVKKPAFQFTSYLSLKSKGNEVTQLQGCLAKLDNNFKTILDGETSGSYGSKTENAVTEFQKKYLPEANPTGEVGKATRKKLNELCLSSQDNSTLLKFTIVTNNQPQLVKTAEILKGWWQKIGATVDIKTVETSEIKQIIKDRNYDMLLYGEALGSEPDLYPFWHSSQISDPGLNLSLYQNKEVDQLLKDARETLDKNTKKQKYEKLQDIIISDVPAIFLYNPNYLYWVSEKIEGIDTTKIIDPAKRFSNVENWYIQTRRVWK